MGKIKASMRINRRYLLVNASKEKIGDALFSGIGSIGVALAAPVYVKLAKKGNVVAVDRKSLENVRAALTLASIKILKVSGTIKGLS